MCEPVGFRGKFLIMTERNCSRCNTKHRHPWGKSCELEIISVAQSPKRELKLESKEGTGAEYIMAGNDYTQLLTEAVARSKEESHYMMKSMENRLNVTMEEKFNRLESLISTMQEKKEEKPQAFSKVYASPVSYHTSSIHRGSGETRHTSSTRHSVVDSHYTGPTHQADPPQGGVDIRQPSAALTGPQVSREARHSQPRTEPTCASTVVGGQLSDALRQLTLAVDSTTVDKTEGIMYRPEWYSQRKLKDTPLKSLDYQRQSLHELYYGMTCVLEYLTSQGSRATNSYIQHMKYVSRQASSNSYVDSAFTGYDRMVVDKFLEDTSKGFQAGDIIAVSSNFHAANFKPVVQKPAGKKANRYNKPRHNTEEPVEIPENWPNDVCYYFNRRTCFGRCSRSHVCKKCRQAHRDIDCKSTEKKN